MEKYKIVVAKAEAYTAMLMKDECKKGKERENYQNCFNKLKINYNQVSIEMDKKQTKNYALRKRADNLKKRIW